MCDAITHRGPDDWGFRLDSFAGGEVAIGMRRLSIIDVAGGHQPISNQGCQGARGGPIWIVFNGEIYNHHQLRDDLLARGHRFTTRSDTETILHLYEEMGARCVEKLRGMFGFAIWDSRDGSLLLARDRLGKKPLHYTLVGDTLVFGSEIKSLLQHPMVRGEVNLEAIPDFLSFGYIPDPATAFKHIYKLPPAHTLTYRQGRISIQSYWDFNYDVENGAHSKLDETECVERLRELLRESVRVRLESEVPLGAFSPAAWIPVPSSP
jgi:asparagine synthase (glutamine-hydrolysing)